MANDNQPTVGSGDTGAAVEQAQRALRRTPDTTLAVDGIFSALGLVPTKRPSIDSISSRGISWNYTTFLNIAFLMVAAVLVLRFLRTGGPAMLRMMNTPEEEMAQHDHALETE